MFIIKLLNSITKNKIFYLNKSGNHYRDFTYIKDVNKICEKLIKIKSFAHEVFNICSGNFANIKKLSEDIKNIFPKAKISNTKANKADVYKTFGSNNKIRKFLKIKKFTKISIGLKNTINWYFKNKIFKVL